jgi:heat shock protein HtpX
MGHRHFNGAKTAMLFGLLGAIVLGASYLLFGQSSGALLIGLLLSLAITGVSYWKSDTIAIRAMRAREVSELEQPVMHRIVRELSARAGQPMPRIYVSPTRAPNAFATGRNPAHAAVAATEGLLELLDERELRGVLGHELMHVYNRDILTSSVAAAVAGVITSLAQMMLIFGGGNDRERGNPLAALAMAILAPFAAMLVQLAVSRTREYDADEDGARLTGDPLALASALRKLELGTQVRPLPQDRELVDVSHLMIANPFRGGGAGRFFATHPPMADRIARLQRMAGLPPA